MISRLKFLFLCLLFTGAAVAAGEDMSFWEMVKPPKDFSTYGYLIDDIFNYTTILNIFYFILVCIGLFGFPYFYYYKRNPKAYYTYGNKKWHIIWVTVIGFAVFFTIDLKITRMSNDHLVDVYWKWPDPAKEEVVRIEVLAQQWAWKFRYAGKDQKFNTIDDVVTVNDMRIPTGKKVLLHITSKDVIHSFYVPNAKLKVDAIPGRITRLWFDSNEAGVYEIACAEMCGTHHYLMKSKLTVYTPEDYLAWLNEAGNIALATNDPENLDLFWGWRWDLTKDKE